MDVLSRIAPFTLGAVTMACLVAGLFFLRYFRDSRDRLFLYFAAAFWLEALNRTLLAFSENPREGDPIIYVIRATGYALIIIGIWNKNRERS